MARNLPLIFKNTLCSRIVTNINYFNNTRIIGYLKI
jgi:hypothetical protein